MPTLKEIISQQINKTASVSKKAETKVDIRVNNIALEEPSQAVPLLIDGKINKYLFTFNANLECFPPKAPILETDIGSNAELIDIDVDDIYDIYDEQGMVAYQFSQEQINKIIKDNQEELNTNSAIWNLCEDELIRKEEQGYFEEEPDYDYFVDNE